MKRIILATLVLAGLSFAPEARAQAARGPMTVDAVSVDAGQVSVTGVVQGQATPETKSYRGGAVTDGSTRAAALEQCHRMLLLALSKPGQYRAEIELGVCKVSVAAP